MIRPLLHKVLLLVLVGLASALHADPRVATLTRTVAPVAGPLVASLPAPEPAPAAVSQGLRDLLRGPCQQLLQSQVAAFPTVRSPAPAFFVPPPSHRVRVARLGPTPSAIHPLE